MTIDERIDLLAPMRPRDAVRVAWLTDALVSTDAAQARLRRWAEAGCPSPPAHAAVGLVGAEPGMFATITRTLERLPPPVRWHVARTVVVVAIGDRARGSMEQWPTVFRANPDEALQLVILSAGPDLESVTAHEIAHTWLSTVRTKPVDTLGLYQDPPDFDALAVKWGSGVRLQVALSEWRTARLAKTWGFAGLGARPEQYETRIREARQELQT